MTNEKEIIGYVQREEGYYSIYKPAKGTILTAALIVCKRCDTIIAGMGGPKPDAICIGCYEAGND